MSRHVKEPMQRGRRSEPFSELCLFAGIMLSDLGFCSGVTPNHEPSMIWPVVGTGEGHGAFCHRSTGEGSRGGASWPRCCWGRLIGGGGSNEGSIAASSSGVGSSDTHDASCGDESGESPSRPATARSSLSRKSGGGELRLTVEAVRETETPRIFSEGGYGRELLLREKSRRCGPKPIESSRRLLEASPGLRNPLPRRLKPLPWMVRQRKPLYGLDTLPSWQ